MSHVRRERVRLVVASAYVCAALAAAVLHQLLGRFHAIQEFELAEDLALFVASGVLIAVIVGFWTRDADQSASALRESEMRYRSLVDSMDDFVFTLDAQQRYSGVFGRWPHTRAFLGCTPAEAFGDEFASRHDAAFLRVTGGASADYEWTAVWDDVRHHLHTSMSPLRGDGDAVIGAVGVTRDVTEKAVLDDAWQQTNNLLHAVVAGSPVAIFTLDSEGRIRSANAAAVAILGKSTAQLLGELLVRPADSEDVARMIRDCANNGTSFTGVEFVRRRDDGNAIALSLSAARLGNGGDSSVVALAADITERRRADEVLQRYRVMAQHIREIAVFVGPNGRIADANEAAVQAYGYTREELIGLPFSTIGAELAIDSTVETEHARKDGGRFPVELNAVRAEIDGQPYVFVLARNISVRRRRQAFERVLHEIDRRILQNQTLDDILTFACAEIAEQYGYALVQLSLRDDDGTVTIRNGGGVEIDFLADLQVRWDDSDGGRGPTGTAIRTGRAQFRDLASDPGFAPWRARALEHGLRFATAVPLIAKDRVLGALSLFTRAEHEIDLESMNHLFAFADQIALSLLAARHQEQIALQTVALESAANAVLVTDVRGVIKWVNPAFERLTGYTSDEAIGATPSMLRSGNHSPTFYRQMWETLAAGLTWSGELWNRRKDGTLYLEEQTITPVRGAGDAITHYVAIKQDVTARRRQEEQIRHLAMHDALTDLPNRRALDGAMERMSWDARRGTPATLMILDVDNFKPVNDTLGHIGGDQLLAEVAKLLRQTLRPADFLARLGGDEFAVLLPDTALAGAKLVADRLRRAASEAPFRFGDRVFDLTISIGLAAVDENVDGPTAMVHADSAMYAAKNAGKNRVVAWPFGDLEGARLIEASRWASRIRNALREERFVLCYQPVVRLGNGEHEHYEALIRMLDEEGQLLPPEDFISAAERFGLMPQIDRWVVENVLRVLSSMNRPVRIFVNISGASLGDAELLAFIEQSITRSGIAAGRLAFEITESAAIRDLAIAQSWIRQLKDLGCLFAIDDFGVGFSSFSYLRALSADYVKIDRSFVTDVDTNPTNRALVQAVMTVAQTLGKEVIAEGVETDAHAAVLLELGIELAQGYRWGVPVREPFGVGAEA
jgi:diguanylate cyclase (GGDEF)-like protein/PAS domain S-box-containing protein